MLVDSVGQKFTQDTGECCLGPHLKRLEGWGRLDGQRPSSHMSLAVVAGCGWDLSRGVSWNTSMWPVPVPWI